MALHNLRGKDGERLAAAYFLEQGYAILHSNWRYRYYEIDIIASKNGVLHIIEVKTRHTSTFGHPEEAVSKKKFANLKKAAEQFMYRYPKWNRVQFDILSITRLKGRVTEFLLIEDVYL